MEGSCVSCNKPTSMEDKAMACDMCDNWEHIGCLYQCDILSSELYEPLKGVS